MKHLIGQSRNGINVYIDLTQNSSSMKDIARQPHLITLAGEALGHTQLTELNTTIEFDMKRPVGYDFVVEKDEDDTVFYVRLIGDTVFTRFVRKGEPVATNYLSICLEPYNDNTAYIVRDIWLGQQRPSRPGSDDAVAESTSYWGHHAFIFQNQPVQTNTLTKTCPY